MRAILLAAGYGTRLRPLTNTIPKCLVPIGGKPLLEIWLNRLSEAEIGPYLINTHYLPKQVDAFIGSSSFEDKVTLVQEDKLLGTAGTLIANLDFFRNDDGMLIHADNYCMADFNEFRNAHFNRPKGCLITMMTFHTDQPQNCGIVEIDEMGIVIRFHEKVKFPPGNLANGAIYILSAEMLEILRKELNNVSDFSSQVLPNFLGRIYTYETKNLFLDIGTPETYAKVNKTE